MYKYMTSRWLNGKRICLQCRRCGFHPLVGKIPWRRAWQPHSSILAWRIPWTEEPVGYSPWCCKESDTTQQLSMDMYIYN